MSLGLSQAIDLYEADKHDFFYTLHPKNRPALLVVAFNPALKATFNGEDVLGIGPDSPNSTYGIKVSFGTAEDATVVFNPGFASLYHCGIALDPRSGEFILHHWSERGSTTRLGDIILQEDGFQKCTVTEKPGNKVEFQVGSALFDLVLHKPRLTKEDLCWLEHEHRVVVNPSFVQGEPAWNGLGQYNTAWDENMTARIDCTISNKTWVQKVNVRLSDKWQTVACKRVPFRGQRELVMEEVVIMEKLHHENLVPLLHHEVCPDSLAMYVPWYEHGDLRHHLHSTRGNYSAIRALMTQSLDALIYLHGAGYLHRDIKPDNIFIASTSPWEFRLADFGLAIAKSQLSNQWAGTSPYVAPEIDFATRQAPQTEIWSLGLTIGEAIGYWTVEDVSAFRHDPAHAFLKVGEKTFSGLVAMIPACSPIRKLLAYMLAADSPWDRPTARQAREMLDEVDWSAHEVVRPGMHQRRAAAWSVPVPGPMPMAVPVPMAMAMPAEALTVMPDQFLDVEP